MASQALSCRCEMHRLIYFVDSQHNCVRPKLSMVEVSLPIRLQIHMGDYSEPLHWLHFTGLESAVLVSVVTIFTGINVATNRSLAQFLFSLLKNGRVSSLWYICVWKRPIWNNDISRSTLSSIDCLFSRWPGARVLLENIGSWRKPSHWMDYLSLRSKDSNLGWVIL